MQGLSLQLWIIRNNDGQVWIRKQLTFNPLVWSSILPRPTNKTNSYRHGLVVPYLFLHACRRCVGFSDQSQLYLHRVKNPRMQIMARVNSSSIFLSSMQHAQHTLRILRSLQAHQEYHHQTENGCVSWLIRSTP